MKGLVDRCYLCTDYDLSSSPHSKCARSDDGLLRWVANDVEWNLAASYQVPTNEVTGINNAPLLCQGDSQQQAPWIWTGGGKKLSIDVELDTCEAYCTVTDSCLGFSFLYSDLTCLTSSRCYLWAEYDKTSAHSAAGTSCQGPSSDDFEWLEKSF
ncbi:unnamed protein product [Polarella glacialis]|uniref:Apple domain-containing protein n=1 Tax=Polarella glacialis TaxID=89957 RepID=A0A813J2S9_POLGL|nr:unnamed protein product [Polarella glacialis]CAE8663843.1 unnamed protein product [Polarella glacialis]